MPQKCSVCTHEKRQEIDQALINGESFRYVSQRFSVSTTALHRHRHGGHIAEALAKAQNAREVAAADNLLDQVRQLQKLALGILAKAANAGDLKTALIGIREARGCLDLLAKLQGDLPQEGTVNIVLSPSWVSLRTVILQTLEPYPEAKLKIAQALKKVDHAVD